MPSTTVRAERRPHAVAHESDSSLLNWLGEMALKGLGAAGLGILSAWAWFGKQLAVMDGKIDLLETGTENRLAVMDNRISEHTMRLAVGEKDFQNLREQLDEVSDGQKELNKKLDRVLEVMIDLRGGHHGR